MIYSLIFVAFIVIIIMVSELTRKVRRLERELSDLRKKIDGHPDTETVHDPLIQPNLEDIRKPEAVPGTYPLETPAGKADRNSPVFDFLKQNALTLIGIFTLVLGIGYFVKYAVDRNWIGETYRAGIGFLTGAVLIVTSHFLRKNYRVFAEIITGGGISVLYFTATLAFREYHLFSQNTAFAIMCLVTLICLLLSYYYDSETLMNVSLTGGFAAPLMISTGESNFLFLFTYIMILNAGMLVVSYLKKRKATGWLAFVLTTVYLFFWTMESADLKSIPFFLISYILFYCFALQDYFREGRLSSSSILLMVLVNFTTVTGTVFIFKELQYSPAVIFPAGFALMNAVFVYREFSRKNTGIAFSAFAGIAVSLLTVAFALQFRTHLITSCWAVEATLLLFIWKKTRFPVFRTCFAILCPLVFAAQLVTWSGYDDAAHLAVIFNPVFLTSMVTVATTIVNMLLLKEGKTSRRKQGVYEKAFPVAAYGLIYTALLLEIIYQTSGNPEILVFSFSLLFSLWYLFILLLFRKRTGIGPVAETILLYLFFILTIINTSIAGTGLVSEVLLGKTGAVLYGLYLLYCFPLVYLIMRILPDSGFYRLRSSYWLLSLTAITAASFELYHLYILLNAESAAEAKVVGYHFSLLYLPILWAVLASILIYKGLKSDAPEYGKAGFALVGLTIIKLYLYDVWRMDHVSRIIAFIILGIILLCSSFLFQRLKKMISHMMEKKEESPENTEPEL
ncbi:DUF2339 domain-containing protein [uncultured Chryseobacterium sp.]|uniref:DUF2339 domain-containing protein n=1 Tax=uncultured Chryseobacterium sp. TaxID=259322 RepID=UPI0025E99563|nr:DUF2339 domain-containing protein [uncultured Chryseobacterium sp.]